MEETTTEVPEQMKEQAPETTPVTEETGSAKRTRTRVTKKVKAEVSEELTEEPKVKKARTSSKKEEPKLEAPSLVEEAKKEEAPQVVEKVVTPPMAAPAQDAQPKQLQPSPQAPQAQSTEAAEKPQPQQAGQQQQAQQQQQQLSKNQQRKLQWQQRQQQWQQRQQQWQQQRRQQMQQRQQQMQQPPSVPRDPNLPEYSLVQIHSWDNAEIVSKLMPDANAEDLGAMKRHEIIFAAIRNYLGRGGAVLASGCLEVVKEGYGFLRSAKTNFLACPEDVFIPQQQIRRHALRTGDIIEGPVRDPRDRDRYFTLGNVQSVNGKTPSEAARIVHFENLVPTFPNRRIVLETEASEYSTRVVDIFTPIGFGQRGLIVAPPRVGKTVLLQKMANAITKNHPEAMLIILLIDERPEEVTDMQRNTKAMVLSSTFDEEPQHHVNVAEMVIEMSRRQAENGKDVIILLDSITRLARAYNTVQPHSGKILTGGVDALALHRPKRFFGAARNIEKGGSLTIIATALIDTGSRMDEVIFEEFKGTGNMELILDRSLADKRIFPAIDVTKSGTRKEDLLLAPLELEKTWGLRRILSEAGPERAMQSVVAGLKKYKSNPEFLLSLDLKNM
jgi:transcription termination factor Rho